MNIWEKAIINMQSGSKRFSTIAVTFSERVKTEIAFVRLSIRVDEAKARIEHAHQRIGKKVVDLHARGDLPETTVQLLQNAEIAASLQHLDTLRLELNELQADLNNVRVGTKTAERQAEEPIV